MIEIPAIVSVLAVAAFAVSQARERRAVRAQRRRLGPSAGGEA